jgi:Flp pilus assembly protein TadD
LDGCQGGGYSGSFIDMKWCYAVALAAWILGAWKVHGQGAENQYLRIYTLITQADSLESSQPREALTKYTEAQGALQVLKNVNPNWNVSIVKFREDYIADKIARLSAKVGVTPPSTTGPPANPLRSTNSTATAPAAVPGPVVPEVPTPPSDWEEQLRALQSRVGQLQNDLARSQGERSMLEAKLREAFAATPVATDPAELAKAQEQIRSLQKEKDLLKVTLDDQKSKASAAPDPKALAQAQQNLQEANQKLATQTSKAEALAKEKQYLQDKLALLAPVEANAEALDATKKALAEAKQQLADQKQVTTRLSLEKDALQARVKTLSAATNSARLPAATNVAQNPANAQEVRELAALRAENSVLKKQLADAKAAASRGRVGELNQQLTEARAQVAALQSDMAIWRLERKALESRLKQVQSAATPATNTAAIASVPAPLPRTNAPSSRTFTDLNTTVQPSGAPDAASREDRQMLDRIRALEKERDDLRKQLETASKELLGAAPARMAELESQLAVLRARLDSFEARQVPFTSEELALLKQPETKVPAEPEPRRRSIQELSPAASRLVVEARQYFSSRQFDKAEASYVEASRQERDTNATVLANLAAIQIERNRFDAADASLKQALASAPDDSYALLVLGNLRYRQARYEDALDALSRAAKLDPQNAEIQNYLGLTLSEKGLRVPAETALRKAVELDPNYASAHNNLAVVYLTQEPPAVELARLHYRKALSAGAPRNMDLEKLIEEKAKAKPN